MIVLGSTSSSDLDTLGALQPVYGGGRSDVFVARVDISAPKLTYLAYIGGGGTDRPRKLVVDRTGRALVVGQTTSPDFPVTHDERTGLSAEDNGFAIMLDPMGTTLLYSLLSGGTSTDTFEGAAIGSDGSLTISGASDSVDFPTVAPMQDEFLGGRFDIVVVRILLGLSTL
ncbi:MAG: SBBP repeat-containing protein [Pseudohongiella sp.]|nr:SBBP repeat-containing protein [Pseudohongiella sp.]